MPDWLGAIAMWNPVSSTADAVRELFGNPLAGGSSRIEQHALLGAPPCSCATAIAPCGISGHHQLRALPDVVADPRPARPRLPRARGSLVDYLLGGFQR